MIVSAKNARAIVMRTEHHTEIRVLIVEDDAGFAYLVREYLERTGKEFITERAGTLGEALEELAERDFDVILADLSLPDSRGAATVGSIIGSGCGAPVIVLSGYQDEAVIEEAKRLGAAGFISKNSIGSDPLLAAVEQALSRLVDGEREPD